MTAEGCRRWRESLGVYALGQLDGPERVALEAHLEGCAECRDEVSSLAGVARCCRWRTRSGWAAPPSPPPASAGGSPPRSPPSGVRLAAGAGSTSAWRSAPRRPPPPPRSSSWCFPAAAASPPQRVDFASLPPGMQISAALEPRPFGTQIRMQVSGVRSGTLCRVFLRRADGARVAAGTFTYRYGGDSEAVLSSALDLSRAEAIGVRAGNAPSWRRSRARRPPSASRSTNTRRRTHEALSRPMTRSGGGAGRRCGARRRRLRLLQLRHDQLELGLSGGGSLYGSGGGGSSSNAGKQPGPGAPRAERAPPPSSRWRATRSSGRSSSPRRASPSMTSTRTRAQSRPATAPAPRSGRR